MASRKTVDRNRNLGPRFAACSGLILIALALAPPAGAAELLWSTGWSNWTTVESAVWTDPVKDFEAADDFDVVGTIEQLVIGGHNSCLGTCSTPPAIDGVWVRFYEAVGGVPGALQYEVFLPAGDPGFLFTATSPETLDITLPVPFEAGGQHFVSVQLSVVGAFYWSVWVANHGNATGSHLWARDNLSGGVWEQQFDVLSDPLNDDLSFSLYGTPPGGGDPPGAVAGCGDWEIVDSPKPPTAIDARLRAVEVIAPWDVWAVGNWYGPLPGVVGNDQRSLVMHWDGTSWSIVPSPSPAPAPELTYVDLLDVAAAGTNDVWAVGHKNDVGAGGYVGPRVLALHWDGTAWSEVELPPPGGASSPFQGASGDRLHDVEVIAADDVWMVGKWYRFLPSDAVIWPGVAMHWNGSEFEVFEPPFVSPTSEQQLDAVSAVASDDIWAVGSGGGNESYIFHYDGNDWTHVPGPTPGTSQGLADVVALATDDVWATGTYTDASGTYPLMLHWNGSTWSQVGSPAGGYDLAALGTDDIYTTGLNGIAHWDGLAWNAEPFPDYTPWAGISDLDPVGPCELWGVGLKSVAGDLAPFTVRLDPIGEPDDADADGVLDAVDNCPAEFNPDQADCDADGAGDVCELTSGTAEDCNGNFVPDNCDSFTDCNANSVPDECEPDCNANGIVDECDITAATSLDCDANGTPDECDVFPDCNLNGIADECDITAGGSTDQNLNGYPDECEALGPDTATVDTIDDVVDFGGAQTLADLPGPDGFVSMREAVMAANNTPGPQTIAFNVRPEQWGDPDAVGPELRIDNGLFLITDDGTTVDFTTQTTFTGDTNPAGKEVSMYGFEPNAWGVTAILVTADGCTIKGMGRVLQRGYAVQFSGNGNRVIDSTISGPIHAGIYITGGWEGPVASDNVIGGTAPGEGNVISSVRIDAPAANNTIVGNVITGGIAIRAGATGNRIGGTTPAERNVISGAGYLSGEGCPVGEQIAILDSDDNVVEGNIIGLTADGLASHGQRGTEGIEIRDSANTVVRSNTIGGILVVGSNHCAGDRFGTAVLVHGASTGTILEGNVLGVAVDGTSPVVNRSGIVVTSWPGSGAPSATLVASNVVANSELTGIFVGSGATGATLSANAVFDNGGLGIYVDPGANGSQAAPAIEAAGTDGATLQLSGTTNGPAGAQLTVEFFASPVCDPSGFGEGAAFVGSTVVTGNAVGSGGFDLTLPGTIPEGYAITATATDTATGGTSSFSACETALAPGQCGAAPGEVQGLAMDPNRTTLSWTSMGDGVTYDVARGKVAWLSRDRPALCMSADQTGTSYNDTESPVAGVSYYYLVRAVNACGAGSWGSQAIGESAGPICP